MEVEELETADKLVKQPVGNLPSSKFTWRIDKYSTQNGKKFYSEPFKVGGYNWRVLIFPKGNGVDYLSMYLDVVDSAKLPNGWSRSAEFDLKVINQLHHKLSLRKESAHRFNAQESDWGFTSFIPLKLLCDPSEGYLVNDTLIVEAQVIVKKERPSRSQSPATTHQSEQSKDEPEAIDSGEARDEDEVQLDAEIQLMEVVNKDKDVGVRLLTSIADDAETIEVKLSGDLVCFHGIAQVDKLVQPILHDAYTHHPELIDSQKDKTQKTRNFALNSLGELLHLLNNISASTGNTHVLRYILTSVEELKQLGFNLDWLNTTIERCLSLNDRISSGLDLKNLEEEKHRLEEQLQSVEVRLEKARLELSAKEDAYRKLSASFTASESLGAKMFG